MYTLLTLSHYTHTAAANGSKSPLVCIHAHTIAEWPLPPESYTSPPLLSLVTDDLPTSSQLTHVREMGDPAYSSDPPELIPPPPSTGIPTDKHQPPILICNGLPPIPPNLVKRVEQGLFIEMSELLPERLCSAELNLGD